jgi:UDP-N-acetylglucosamine--N-acetylmuramyl-(pentapeptide) pyrophosphoryl-undecaprenol N-acetylglucosamine transferase
MSAQAFVFAGGGTGGHLFPGLAIAERLRARSAAGVRLLFLCSDRPLDAKILTDEGAEFRVVPAKPMSLRPRGLVRFLGSWGPSVRAGRAVLRELKGAGDEVTVIAMGGFVAAPVVQAARAERCRAVLVNLDAVPGKANRWIARRADLRFTAAPVVGGGAKQDWRVVPPIVRVAALNTEPKGVCRAGFALDPEASTLLVTGASQGASSINRLLMELVRTSPAAFRGWQIIHQTGQADTDEVRAAYAEAGLRAVAEPFFRTMGRAWGAADLAVSRAGAGSVAEAWANRVPTVFLPYPYHRDQHQKFNAKVLEDAGAAVVIEDLIDPIANVASAGRLLLDLLSNGTERGRMGAALTKLGPADGADRIARAVLGQAR